MITAEPLCDECVMVAGKLCHRHEREILPQLARNVGWLKLMGEAIIEQTARQHSTALPVSAPHKAHLERKRQARKPSRGIRGLLLAIRAA